MNDIAQRFGSGQAVRRIEDEGLLKGLGQYTDDLAPAGLLRLVFVRSPHPHARIAAIDTAAAAAMPGVRKVVTGAELLAAGVKPIPTLARLSDGSPVVTAPRRVLAHERVRYVGEAVALVVAESLQQARDAAEAVQVDYEELPHVVDLAAAAAPGAPSASIRKTRPPPGRRGRSSARSSGCRTAARNSCPPSTAATSRRRPNWRWPPTAGSSRCGCARWPTSAATQRPAEW